MNTTEPRACRCGATARNDGSDYSDVCAQWPRCGEFAYECPDCGEGHDGMTTGTEFCPNCQDDRDSA